MKAVDVRSLVILLAATFSIAFGDQIETEKPLTVEIGENCGAVARVALPWLKRHSIQIEGTAGCADQPCTFPLHISRIRKLNFNGRYVQGGNWHSFLTAPRVMGGYGELTLTPKSANACILSLANFVFGTGTAGECVPGPDGVCTDFNPAIGPDVKSNHRLEREYANGIVSTLARHLHP